MPPHVRDEVSDYCKFTDWLTLILKFIQLIHERGLLGNELLSAFAASNSATETKAIYNILTP